MTDPITAAATVLVEASTHEVQRKRLPRSIAVAACVIAVGAAALGMLAPKAPIRQHYAFDAIDGCLRLSARGGCATVADRTIPLNSFAPAEVTTARIGLLSALTAQRDNCQSDFDQLPAAAKTIFTTLASNGGAWCGPSVSDVSVSIPSSAPAVNLASSAVAP